MKGKDIIPWVVGAAAVLLGYWAFQKYKHLIPGMGAGTETSPGMGGTGHMGTPPKEGTVVINGKQEKVVTRGIRQGAPVSAGPAFTSSKPMPPSTPPISPPPSPAPVLTYQRTASIRPGLTSSSVAISKPTQTFFKK